MVRSSDSDFILHHKVRLCQECIEWAKEEKRTFLRQSLEARLVALYFDTKRYQESLKSGVRAVFCV